MPFRYELFIVIRDTRSFIETTQEAGSVREALFKVLMKDKKLCSRMLLIYCRRQHSKDLKYMGLYDGGSGRNRNGETLLNILSLANRDEYHLTDDGFKRCLF